MITATDLFCGAGGSSWGAEQAGVRLLMAANHWPKAIEVHQDNFPHAGHDCADISQVDPRRYPRTDLLLASPECTNHSSARGISRRSQDPSLFDSPDLGAERSRATMWDVHRFVEHHRYDAVIVENVVDATRWTYWPSWWQAWGDAGYDARVVSLNSAHTGEVPQWRDRIYVIAVRRGVKADLEMRPPSWCPTCERVVEGRQVFRRAHAVAGKWRQQYDYRCSTCHGVVEPPAPPAATIIDWQLRGTRIGDRARPLAPATRRRIELGLQRYGSALVAAAGNTWEKPGSGYARAWPLTDPAPTQAATAQHALVVPVHHGSRGPAARPTSIPHPTQTGRQEHAVVSLPFMVYGYDYGGPDGCRVKPLDEPMGAIVAAGGTGRYALVVPMRTNGRARPADEPVATIAAGPGGGGMHLVFAPQSGGAPHPVDDPAPAQAAKATPLLVSYYRTGDARPLDEPASTVTTRDRHALVEPAIEVDDCLFRMLEPHEAGRAMAFPDSYRVEGTKRDRVRLYGNAVTPPAMTLLAQRVLAALGDAA